jgi:hypothetical protein
MANLARVCLQTNDLSFALELYNDCYTRSRLVNGDDHPNTLLYLSSLASCYRALGQSDLALGMFEKCYAGECRVLGVEHVSALYLCSIWPISWQSPRDSTALSTCSASATSSAVAHSDATIPPPRSATSAYNAARSNWLSRGFQGSTQRCLNEIHL